MIKKSYDIDTSLDETIRVEVLAEGVIQLSAGTVSLTFEEAKELAHCLLDLTVGDSTTTIQFHESVAPHTLTGAPPLMPKTAQTDLLEYGDGGKLNPQ